MIEPSDQAEILCRDICCTFHGLQRILVKSSKTLKASFKCRKAPQCSMNLMILAALLISVGFLPPSGISHSTNAFAFNCKIKKGSREHNDYNSIVNCLLGLQWNPKWVHVETLSTFTVNPQIGRNLPSCSWEKLLEWNHGLIFHDR